jgi:hypothetical protein
MHRTQPAGGVRLGSLDRRFFSGPYRQRFIVSPARDPVVGLLLIAEAASER